MTNNFLIHNFKHLTTTPANVEQLKKLVLQMAVQGKLTAKWREENPNVEPSSDLLNKIEIEKEELIKTGKLRKQRELLSIPKEEIPHEIPNNWKWERLGNVCFKITDGFHNTPPKVENGFPYILATHVKSNKIDWDNCYYVEEKFHRELYNKSLPQRGEILLVNIGAGCGTPAIIDVDYEFSFKNVAILKFPQTNICNHYLKYYFDLNRKDTYDKITRGGAQPFLSLKIINNLLIPIPPFQEQLEIIEKINYFFLKIDQLYALAQKRLNYREKSARALFSKINHAGNDTELQKTWQILTAHFHTLTQSKESVKQLRQSILQLAVQGKLTAKWRESVKTQGLASPDNPNYNARALLKKIKAEKEQLIKDGKIKRPKPLPHVADEEKPFELPENWEWVRLIDYGLTNTGTTPSKNNPEYFGRDYPFVKPAEISLKGINYDTEDGLTKIGLKQGRLIPSNSVLMVCIGGSIGKSFYTNRDVSCNQQINTITPLALISSEFLHYFLQSIYFQSEVWNRASGGTTPIINKGKWERIPISLPPLEEQKTIVSKVKQLMAWCDELEKKIEKRDAYQKKMMQAVVKQAFKTEKEIVEAG